MKSVVLVCTLLLAAAVACSSGGSATDARDTAGNDVATDTAGELPGDALDSGLPQDATDVADVPGDDGPAADADLPSPADAADTSDAADAPQDVAPDVPDLPVWTDLVPTGLPLDRIVGIASQMNTKAPPNAERDFEYAQYAPYPGFRMRNGHRWEDVEREQGVWTWDGASGSVDGADVVGSKVLMGLDYAPEWACDQKDVYGTVHIDDFANYAGQMAGHFCDQVKEYEIWNEENLARFWQPAADPAKYADMVIASTAAIHAACPDAKVAFGGMSSYDEIDVFNTWGFLRLALAARPALCDSFDVLALHPYTWFQYDTPEHDEFIGYGVAKPSQTAMVRIARQILADAGCAQKPIGFTEVGWPSYELSEDTVASYAVRSLLLTARDGVDAWCWYTFWDTEPITTGMRPHEHYFGMFGWVGPDGTTRRAKPAWKAVTAALDRLGTSRFARDLGPALHLPNDVYVLVFLDDQGNATLAMWDGRDQPDVTEDGDEPGGPDTTYDLDLPLPCGSSQGLTLYGQDGTPQHLETPGPSVRIPLTPSVQILPLGCALM